MAVMSFQRLLFILKTEMKIFIYNVYAHTHKLNTFLHTQYKDHIKYGKIANISVEWTFNGGTEIRLH